MFSNTIKTLKSEHKYSDNRLDIANFAVNIRKVYEEKYNFHSICSMRYRMVIPVVTIWRRCSVLPISRTCAARYWMVSASRLSAMATTEAWT